MRKQILFALILAVLMSAASVPGMCEGAPIAKTAIQFPRLMRYEGAGMKPTLRDGMILVTPQTEYARGDIVAVEMEGWIMVARLIAFGGETVRVDEVNGQVYIDGVSLEESWLPEGVSGTPWGQGDLETEVPAGCVHLLDDNRANSADNRWEGRDEISAEAIIGAVQTPEQDAE